MEKCKNICSNCPVIKEVVAQLSDKDNNTIVAPSGCLLINRPKKFDEKQPVGEQQKS